MKQERISFESAVLLFASGAWMGSGVIVVDAAFGAGFHEHQAMALIFGLALFAAGVVAGVIFKRRTRVSRFTEGSEK